MSEVTVIIPTVPGREDRLARAIKSVQRQTLPVLHIVERDELGEGPSATRNRAVERADTEWIAFLDDDDELYARHIESLLGVALAEGTDAAYSGYDQVILHSARFGRVCNQGMTDYAHPMPVTFLVRRSAFLAVGGFPEEKPEEYHLQVRLRESGVVFAHFPERTWRYNVHGKNTSGLPEKAHKHYGSPSRIG